MIEIIYYDNDKMNCRAVYDYKYDESGSQIGLTVVEYDESGNEMGTYEQTTNSSEYKYDYDSQGNLKSGVIMVILLDWEMSR